MSIIREKRYFIFKMISLFFTVSNVVITCFNCLIEVIQNVLTAYIQQIRDFISLSLLSQTSHLYVLFK